MLAVSIVWAVAAWVVSPRYELEKPSLVDDWWAIEESPEQLPVALRLGNPETQRFRPGLILWNYLQWHTFDAPRGRAPNIWNLARLLVLVAGLALLTLLALPPPHEGRGGVILAGTAHLLRRTVGYLREMAQRSRSSMLDDIVASDDLGGEAFHTDGCRSSRIGVGEIDIVQEQMTIRSDRRPPVLKVGADTVIGMVSIDEEDVNRVGRDWIEARVGNDELDMFSEVKALERSHD